MLIFVIQMVSQAWTRGRLFATVNARGWESERLQIQAWRRALAPPSPKLVRTESAGGNFQQQLLDFPSIGYVEFDTGSFWAGYWTYRLLNTGNSWALAKFKKGTSKLCEFRILDHNALITRVSPDGKPLVSTQDKSKFIVHLPADTIRSLTELPAAPI